MTVDYADPRRQALRFDDWPEADGDLWRRARQPGGILEEDAGPWADWSEGTERTRRHGYGRWLGFLHRVDLLAADQPPADRITPDAVQAYFEHLEALEVALASRLTYLVTLLVVAEGFAPRREWNWLRAIVRKSTGASGRRGTSSAGFVPPTRSPPGPMPACRRSTSGPTPAPGPPRSSAMRFALC